MLIKVNGKNIEITQAIKDYTREKIGKVVNHFDQIREVQITLNVTKNPSVAENHTAEVTCFLNGLRIHVKEEAESMYASIDLIADKLSRQLKKHKDKALGKSKTDSIRTNLVGEGVAEEEAAELDDDIIKIDIKPE